MEGYGVSNILPNIVTFVTLRLFWVKGQYSSDKICCFNLEKRN